MTGRVIGEAVAIRETVGALWGKCKDGVGVVVMACAMFSPACEVVDCGGKPEVNRGLPPAPPLPGYLLDAIYRSDS